MAHRKRSKTHTVPQRPQSTKERIVTAIGVFVRENVRSMLLVAGFMTLVQAAIPWTNSATDRIPFIVVGSIFLGIGIPRRLWR